MAIERIKREFRTVIDWLGRVITEPRSELTRWQTAVRYAYDMGRYGANQLRRDQAPQMAAALSFRTLFGILPVLVVMTIVVRVIGDSEVFYQQIATFFGKWARMEELKEPVLKIVERADTLNVAALTWVSVGILVYAAISLMVTIESCFNRVLRAPEGRSGWRRFLIYWAVLPLTPLIVGMTAWANREYSEFVVDYASWALNAAPMVWSFVVTWLLMTFLYMTLPNTSVQTRAALIGAFVAAVLVEIGRNVMAIYLPKALAMGELASALGSIPLFMFWVYLMWLVVLFGLEVTATIQMLAGRRLGELEHRGPESGLVDPAAILTVTEAVARRFRDARTTSVREAAEETGLPERTVLFMFQRLAEARIIHRTDREDGAVTLAQPPENIPAKKLMEIGFALADSGGQSVSPILDRLREAQRALTADASLAQLLAPQVHADQGAAPS